MNKNNKDHLRCNFRYINVLQLKASIQPSGLRSKRSVSGFDNIIFLGYSKTIQYVMFYIEFIAT